MLRQICPKLPMRNKSITRNFYVNQLGFRDTGAVDYPDYLLLQKDEIEIHFFAFPTLDPEQNDGQVYIRTDEIRSCHEDYQSRGVVSNALEIKPWGQLEFSVLDPDHNLLTFGQAV